MAHPMSPDSAPVDRPHLAARWLRVASRWERWPGEDAVEVVFGAGGGRVDLVLAALRDDNPGPGPSVVDRGYEVVVRAPERLSLTTATLSWHLGPGFGLAQVRSLIVSASARSRPAATSCCGRLRASRGSAVPGGSWGNPGRRRTTRPLRRPAMTDLADSTPGVP